VCERDKRIYLSDFVEARIAGGDVAAEADSSGLTMAVNPQVPAGPAAATARLPGGPRTAGAEATEVVARSTSFRVAVEVTEVGTLGHAVRAVPRVKARVARRRTLQHTNVRRYIHRVTGT